MRTCSLNLVACSWISETNEESLLQLEIVSKEVMALYIEEKLKFRKVMTNLFLEDHNWCLKSYDSHSKAIVILHCLEYKKEFGGTDGHHSKDRVSNLFSNFRKSHIMSNQHIRKWCLRKGLDWCNHPQSIAKSKKTCYAILLKLKKK